VDEVKYAYSKQIAGYLGVTSSCVTNTIRVVRPGEFIENEDFKMIKKNLLGITETGADKLCHIRIPDKDAADKVLNKIYVEVFNKKREISPEENPLLLAKKAKETPVIESDSVDDNIRLARLILDNQEKLNNKTNLTNDEVDELRTMVHDLNSKVDNMQEYINSLETYKKTIQFLAVIHDKDDSIIEAEVHSAVSAYWHLTGTNKQEVYNDMYKYIGEIHKYNERTKDALTACLNRKAHPGWVSPQRIIQITNPARRR
jgi:hypothetical protein